MNELLRLANKKSTEYPELKDNIDNLLQSCFEDIDSGRPQVYEIELCYDSVKSLTVKIEPNITKVKAKTKSKNKKA